MARNHMLIPAEPYALDIDPAHTALLIIDMQHDFCSANGWAHAKGIDVTPAANIIPRVKQLLDGFRSCGMLVVHTREGHKPDMSDCPESKLRRSANSGAAIGEVGPAGRYLIIGSQSHDIVPELYPISGEAVIDKPGKGAFFDTNLQFLLNKHQITTLVVTGVTTHVCVASTVREANDRGFDCLVLRDATAAYNAEDHEQTIRMIHDYGGIFGWVSEVKHVIQMLAKLPQKDGV